MVLALSAGVPVVLHNLFAVGEFMFLRDEIAKAQGMSEQLADPGADESGFNAYERGLWKTLAEGKPLAGIGPELADRAKKVGRHLDRNKAITFSWIGVLVLVGLSSGLFGG